MIDLDNPQHREDLAQRIKEDINDYCKELYREGHRNHLGASLMGEACDRKLFNVFRWVKEEDINGRVQRLFQVGKMAEPRFIQYLRGIGFEVWDKPENDKQFRISAHNGHYGGSLDGVCKPPARYGIDENIVFLDEFKTNGTGAGFTNVNTKGLKAEKPKHYEQMCQYGYHYKIKYGLYLIENKNDSDIIVQIVELDWKRGAELEKRAGDIINAKFPPAKIAENPSYYDCKFCTFSGICHEGQPVEKNCRSCKLASPVENAEWYCDRFKMIIPKDFIKVGCDGHTSIMDQ